MRAAPSRVRKCSSSFWCTCVGLLPLACESISTSEQAPPVSEAATKQCSRGLVRSHSPRSTRPAAWCQTSLQLHRSVGLRAGIVRRGCGVGVDDQPASVSGAYHSSRPPCSTALSIWHRWRPMSFSIASSNVCSSAIISRACRPCRLRDQNPAMPVAIRASQSDASGDVSPYR